MDAPPFPRAGEVFALLCALVWASAVILLRRGGEHVPPLALNLFKNTVAFALLVVSLVVLGRPLLPPVALGDVLVLVVSGVLGLAIADTLFLAGLNRIGASRAAIVDCLYSPSVVVCAAVGLGEALSLQVVGGVVLVAAAVVVGTHQPPGGDREPQVAGRELWLGVALGAAAMVVMAVGIVMVKPVLARTDVWWATTVRLAAGAALPALACACTARGRAQARAAFTPGPAWRVTVPAAVVGTYVSMVLWIAGFKHAQATVASVLNQTSTVFTLLLATVVLREPLTGRRLLAILLGCAGALLATLSSG